jgi:hypothetical protein
VPEPFTDTYLIHSEAIEKLIQGVSDILRKTPKLLRDFNSLLPADRFRIECPTDVQEVGYFSVITPSGARIQYASGLTISPNSPRLPTNTAELRKLVMSDRPWEILSAKLEPGWTSCLLQLLQTVRGMRIYIYAILTTYDDCLLGTRPRTK